MFQNSITHLACWASHYLPHSTATTASPDSEERRGFHGAPPSPSHAGFPLGGSGHRGLQTTRRAPAALGGGPGGSFRLGQHRFRRLRMRLAGVCLLSFISFPSFSSGASLLLGFPRVNQHGEADAYVRKERASSGLTTRWRYVT